MKGDRTPGMGTRRRVIFQKNRLGVLVSGVCSCSCRASCWGAGGQTSPHHGGARAGGQAPPPRKPHRASWRPPPPRSDGRRPGQFLAIAPAAVAAVPGPARGRGEGAARALSDGRDERRTEEEKSTAARERPCATTAVINHP